MAQSRGSVNQKLYLGAESVIGAAVGAVKKFPSLSIQFDRMQDDQFYTPAGQLVPGSGVKHREWSEPTFNLGPDYNELAYIFSGLFGPATITNPGAGAAYQWVWTPSESDFGAAQAFTARRGDTIASGLVPGLHFNSLELALADERAEASGNCFGYAINDTQGPIDPLTDEVWQLVITGSPTGGTFTITYSSQTTTAIPYNATPAEIEAALIALSNIGPDDVRVYGSQLPSGTITIHATGALGGQNLTQPTTTDSLTGGSTPATAVSTIQAGGAAYTTIAQQPISKSELNVYIDSTAVAIGTTKFCDCLEWGISIPPIRNPVKVLCTTYPSFKDSVQVRVEEMRSRAVLIKNTDVITFMSSYNTKPKPTRYFRYEAIGALIGGSNYYKLWIDQALKCETPKDIENVQETFAYEVPNRFCADVDLGGPIKVTLVNTLSGL
jgi:hypothetical protein